MDYDKNKVVIFFPQILTMFSTARPSANAQTATVTSNPS